MLDRRQFIQSCLSAMVGASLTSPAKAWSLVDPALSPTVSSREALPTIFEKMWIAEPKFKVIGVGVGGGGGGGNVARHMID